MHQSVVFNETEFYDSVKIYADNHFVKHVKVHMLTLLNLIFFLLPCCIYASSSHTVCVRVHRQKAACDQ